MVEIPVSVGHFTFDDGKNLGGWGMDNAPKIVMVFVRLVTTQPRQTPGMHRLTMNQVSLSRMVNLSLEDEIKGSVAGELVLDSRILTDTKAVVTSLPSRLQLIGRKLM